MARTALHTTTTRSSFMFHKALLRQDVQEAVVGLPPGGTEEFRMLRRLGVWPSAFRACSTW